VKRAGDTVIALSSGLDRLCLFLAKAALVGMVFVIMLQVVARYGFRQPPAWTEELARYLMVWGGLLGASAAFRRALDPAVVRVDENAGDRRAFFAKLAIALTTMIFIGPILYYSLFGAGLDPSRSFVMRLSARTSPGLGVNLAFIAAAIPTVCMLILVHLAARLLRGPILQSRQEPL
jgi:TRAP-type C4-dicarboxylate transport system permease small subunit